MKDSTCEKLSDISIWVRIEKNSSSNSNILVVVILLMIVLSCPAK